MGYNVRLIVMWESFNNGKQRYQACMPMNLDIIIIGTHCVLYRRPMMILHTYLPIHLIRFMRFGSSCMAWTFNFVYRMSYAWRSLVIVRSEHLVNAEIFTVFFRVCVFISLLSGKTLTCTRDLSIESSIFLVFTLLS